MTCSIYVIGREQGPVKVGISQKPHVRAYDLQTGCPYKIDLLFAAECESRAQARAFESQVHGVLEGRRMASEWFDVEAWEAIECAETAIQIDQHCKAMGWS
jgi:hypothetical protein